MEIGEVLRSVYYDFVEYIQEKVKVEFDYKAHKPIGFVFRKRKFEAEKVLGPFKMTKEHPPNSYVLFTKDKEVYFLYFHYLNFNPCSFINSGVWVLSFRVLKDKELKEEYLKERKMLVDIFVKRVVDFHGHLCPDLAIGIRLCEYINQVLSEKGMKEESISLVAENSTSAIDAIQVLLGTTIGNQRLQIVDLGKHNYILALSNQSKGLKFSLKEIKFPNEDFYLSLEKKIYSDEILFEEVVIFQKMLDERVYHIFNLPLKDLFEIKEVDISKYLIELPTSYVRCSVCGEMVLKDYITVWDHKLYCRTCFKKSYKNKLKIENINLQ